MSEWITDREPTDNDAPMDYIIVWSDRWNVPFIIDYGDWHKRYPWMPISKPEPYVAPEPNYYAKLWPSEQSSEQNRWCVYCNVGGIQADNLPTREAAERIAAIYNEVIP